ncbi:MAG: hypothetical protein HGB17_16350 [Syntrophobacteraceae bacterium]|nr:hypothetical protein [Syntrophobacteraceae bacterium]
MRKELTEAMKILNRKMQPIEPVRSQDVPHILKKRLMIRKAGKMVQHASLLFPGYLFFESDSEDISPVVHTQLRRTTGFIRFLPSTANPAPMRQADVELIRRFLSFGKEIGLSLVTFDENDRIKVLQGPMAGLEGHIVKVDKRKRRAKVRLDMYDDIIHFDLGFELLSESKGEDPR